MTKAEGERLAAVEAKLEIVINELREMRKTSQGYQEMFLAYTKSLEKMHREDMQKVDRRLAKLDKELTGIKVYWTLIQTALAAGIAAIVTKMVGK